MSNESQTPCYLYDPANPFAWGDCCAELSIIPKPIWVVLLFSVPIEAVLAGADVKADASVYEKKSNQTALIFLGYNLLTLTLLAIEFEWGECEASAEGVWVCYQGILFMFYNSTAALASLTLWMLIIMRKYYIPMYMLARMVIVPSGMWKWFDQLNSKTGGTHAVIKRWRVISSTTKLYWYNKVGIVIFLLFGGISHIIPMLLAYPYVMIAMFIAMVYAHSLRLGYASLESGSNFKSMLLGIGLFYPISLVLTLVSVAFSPVALLLKVFGCHPMDRRQNVQVGQETDGDSLQILVRTEGGAMITLDVDREASVQSLLPIVKDNLGLAFDKRVIHLKFEDAMLDESPNANLQTYGLGNGDVLQLVVEPDEIDLTIRMENGDVVVIQVPADSSIDQLRARVEGQTGIPRGEQWILYEAEVVDGSRTVRSLANAELELFDVNMTLNVEVSSGDSHQVIIRRDATYADLVGIVAGLVQLDVSDIVILFNDQPMDEQMTLHAQGLRNGSTVVANIPEESLRGSDDEAYFEKEEEEKKVVLEKEKVSNEEERVRVSEDARGAVFDDEGDDQRSQPPPARRAKQKKGLKVKQKDKEALPPPAPKAVPKKEEGLSKSAEQYGLESSLEPEGEIYEGDEIEEEIESVVGELEQGQAPVVLEDWKAKKAKRKERALERRRRIRGYIKDILRNLCMFDPNGKVIMFAAATTFLSFTFAANYGILLYSGAPYIEAIALDWNARGSLAWFSCTAENFVDPSGFGLLDFLGLAIGTTAAVFEFVDFLATI